ncbi:MAG: acyltransferase domain-containing protein, partial [Candidatus Binataceae bacterium]
DGRSGGLTVPNGPAQESVLRDALTAARLEGSDIDYVEAHGTGTSLGDPIEVRALGRILGEGRNRDTPLMIGSVKTNIGHLESAAGVAGFIKVVLSLRHEAIPRHLNFKDPNPFIEWASLPVAVVDEEKPWVRGTRPRRAGVSSFGFSGTNAHVVLEEAPDEIAPIDGVDRPLHCLTVSAQSEASLRDLCRLYAETLAPERAFRLCDVAHVAGTGRSHLMHRLAVVAANESQARAALLAATAGDADPKLRRGKIMSGQSTEVVFLYTGAGAQYPGMGGELYQTSPVFREAIDYCDKLLGPDANGLTLKSVMAATAESAAPIHEIGWAQPAMFAIEYALTKLWRSWGVIPSAVIGHSVGEYAAACVAGVFSVEDGLRLIAERGRLMQSLPPGGMMAALFAPIDEIEAAIFPLRGRVAIAAFNAPGSVVISGETSAVEIVLADFARRNVIGQRLFVSLAAHSPLMEPALDRMERLAGSVAMSPPTIPIAWNLTGRPLPNGVAPDAIYWRSHMREPVRFADGIKSLYDDGFRIFLEVGPHPTLLALAQQSLPEKGNLLLTSLRRGREDWNELLTSLADLHVHGVPVDFAGLDRPYQRRRVTLPTYPFDRERYWAAPMPRLGQGDSDRGTAAKGADAQNADGLYYKIEWEPAPSAYPCLRRPSELKEEAVDRFKQLAAQNDFAIYDRSRPEFDRLTVDFICKAFIELGFDPAPGRRFSTPVEASRLGVAQRHLRLFEGLIALLTRHKVLVSDGAEYVVASMPTGDPIGRSIELLSHFSEVSAELEILRRCGAELSRVLTGHQDPLNLLFDEPGFEQARRLYAESPFSRTFNETLASLLQRVGGKRPLRILEIGAGTGGTTRYVLPVIGADAKYTFTDISPLLLAEAKNSFKSDPRLSVALLDIERGPALQGFESGAYDIIIASNVLHATAELQKSMQHIGDLLVPSGLFFAIEGLAPETWVNITFGLTEGWWRFTDIARRPSGPLLDAAGWRDLLAEVGFSDIVLIPDLRSDDGGPHQAIIMAAWPEKRRRWLILSDDSGLGLALKPALSASGDAVELIETPKWRPAMSSPDVVKKQPWWPDGGINSDGPPADIIYLGALKPSHDTASYPDFASREAFVLLQAAAGLRTGRVWFVTRGAQDVRGPEDVIAPDQAGLWGLGRTFSLEHPVQWGGVVDLDPTTSPLDAIAPVLEAIRDAREYQSAWRDGARCVPRLITVAPPPPRAYALRSDLSYLITGGLGGLGLAVAEWLASRGAQSL